MSLQFPYKAQHRFSSRSKPATRDTLFQETSCQTSWTVHEVSLRTLWLRIQCSLVELGLPASMTSERIHPCILLTSHSCNSGKSYKVLHNCLLTSFKAKKKRNVKNLLMKLFATFLRMYEMMGLKECHVVSRKESSWLNPRVPLSKLFIPST